MINPKEIPQLVRVNNRPASGQIIINGQVMQAETTVLECPKCSNLVVDFQQTLPRIYISRAMEMLDAASLPVYCPVCGQKLRYDRDIIDEEDSE